jgi:5-methyltetrahydrofolate--homocysteine methyltransferase
MMGLTSAEMVKMVVKLPNQPLAFGANCGRGRVGPPADGAGLSRGGTREADHRQGQRGIPRYHEGHIHYDGTPELMAEYAVLARDAGPRSSAAAAGPCPTTCADARGAGDAAARASGRRWR